MCEQVLVLKIEARCLRCCEDACGLEELGMGLERWHPSRRMQRWNSLLADLRLVKAAIIRCCSFSSC